MAVSKKPGEGNCVTAITLLEMCVFVSVFRLHNGRITEAQRKQNQLNMTHVKVADDGKRF